MVDVMTNKVGRKIISCFRCGTELEISKFASPKLTQCYECRDTYGATGKRDVTRPAKGTKQYAIDALDEQFVIYDRLNDIINKAVEAGEIKSGWILAHGMYHDYSYNWFNGFDDDNKCRYYGNGRKQATVSEFNYHAGRVKEQIEKIGIELIEAGVDLD